LTFAPYLKKNVGRKTIVEERKEENLRVKKKRRVK